MLEEKARKNKYSQPSTWDMNPLLLYVTELTAHFIGLLKTVTSLIVVQKMINVIGDVSP